MKKIVLLSVSIAFMASVLFTACQKEQVIQSVPQTTIAPELNVSKTIQNGTIKTDNLISFSIPPPICMFLGTANQGHCELPSGFCHYDWFDWHHPAGINQAPGYGTVDAGNNLIFDFNITEVEPAYLDCINNEGVFRVAQGYQIPNDILQSIYDNAGLAKPEGDFTIPAGDYPVQMMYGGEGPCLEDHLIAYFSDWAYSPIIGWYPTNVSYFHIQVPCSGGGSY